MPLPRLVDLRAPVFRPAQVPDCLCSLCTPRPDPPAALRAQSLLSSFLDDTQREQLRTKGNFEVIGSDGVTYLIHATFASGNVVQLDKNGRPYKTWCCYPSYYPRRIPVADLVLGQVLALKTDAKGFRRVGF